MTASPKTKAPAPAEQPTPIAAQPTAAPQPLKRLQVVAQAGSLAYTTGEHLYKRLKAVTPPFVAPGLERVEGVAGQVLPTVSQTAEQLLRAADARVDSLLDGLDAKAGGKPLESLLSALSAAGDYAVIVAKEGSASVAAGVQSARDSLQAAVDKAREATDPDVGVAMAWDAWAKFSSYPPVKAFLERAEPATNLALQTFLSIHNNLVTSYVYKTAVNTTASTLNYASTTTPYKLGAQYLYPFVQTVADPAISKVAQSKVIGQVIDYWKPQAAPAPVNAH